MNGFKHFISYFIFIFIFLFALVKPTEATFTVNYDKIGDTTLNGSNFYTGTNGQTVDLQKSVTLDGASTWRSTAWRIADSSGTMICFDNTDRTTNGTYIETWAVTLPVTSGTYNYYVQGCTNNLCTVGCSTLSTYTGAVVIAPAPTPTTVVPTPTTVVPTPTGTYVTPSPQPTPIQAIDVLYLQQFSYLHFFFLSLISCLLLFEIFIRFFLKK